MLSSLRTAFGPRSKQVVKNAEAAKPGTDWSRWPAIRRLFGQMDKTALVAYWVLFLMLAISEVFGITMLFPILIYLQGGEEAFETGEIPRFLTWALSIAPAMGLPINLGTLFGIAFAPILLRQVFKVSVAAYGARVQEGTTARLREKAFGAFVQTDLPFFASHQQGKLMSVLILEAQHAGTLASNVMLITGTLMVLFIYLTMLLMISPMMTLIAFGTGIFASLISSLFLVPKARQYGLLVSRGNDHLSNSLIEALSGVRTIKMLAQEQEFTGMVARATRSLQHAASKVLVYSTASGAVVEPLFVLGTFAVLFVGSEVLGVGLATLGILFLALLRVMPLANTLNTQRQSFVAKLANLQNYDTTLAEATDSLKIASGPVAFQGLNQGIEFDRVGYSYSPENSGAWALEEVTFSVHKGTMTAIVGRSGAGKSTMVELIPRLRDPGSGEIRIDGVNIKEFNLTTLRRSIGFVSQDTFLFNDTIYNNISFGLPSATPEQVEEAAKKAYAHDFIKASPDGYDSIVGDRGVRLSAGQRQRLGIARVMLQDPDIIILDEPTSALDSESEYYIRSGFDKLREEKTMIVIAHRLSTIQQADEIIVLVDGRIVERGNHQALLEAKGDYGRLFELQIHS